MSGRTRLTVMAGLASLLAAAALRPLFASMDYLLPIAGVVLVVGLAAETARRLALPTLLGPLAALLALGGYLVAVFAHRQAVLGVLPGGQARAALAALVSAGRDDISRLAPPVPLTDGVLLLTTAGVGLVAVLVDLIAVSLRRAAAAGLPLFALFVVPAAIAPHGIGAGIFVVAASGFLALLVADGRERLGRWGRPLGAGRRHEAGPALRAEVAETSPLARVGRRIAAASLGLALVVPGLLPGVSDRPLGGRGIGQGPGGSRSVTAINPITSLKRQLTSPEDTPVLIYTRDADAGYLRLTTLDDFDGKQWSQSVLSVGEDHRVSLGIPDPPGLSPTVPTHNAQVQVQVRDSFREPWLPLPYPATEVYVDGDWRYDDATRTVFSSRTSTQGISYRAKARVPEPTADLLRAAGPPTVDPRYLRLPSGKDAIPAEVIALAHDVVGDAPTDFDKAVALQQFFHKQFKYDLTVQDGNGTDALERFLLRDRRGYCEQFASAMAALARVLGIPARVDIGFTPGTRVNGGLLVTVHDAHAWPELWFNGVGWVPFEPTPRSDGQVRQPPYSLASTPGPGQPTVRPTATDAPSAAPTHKAQSRLEEAQAAAAARKRSGGNGASGWLLAGIGLAVVLLLGAAPAAGRVIVRRRRWARAETRAAAAHVAWAELHDTACDLGLGWDPTQTPRSLVRRLGQGLDEAPAAALLRIGELEERARYARSLDSAGDADPRGALPADVATVTAALRAAAARRRRVRATLAPRSVLTAALHGVTGVVADALDGVDAVLAAASRLGRRAVHPLRG